MAQSGKIQAITGLVTARSQEGTVRELHVGDVVFENEIIATATGASISIVQEDGNILALTGDDQILLDESVNGSIAPSDAVVQDVADLQEAIIQALENNTDIDEALEETAAGELDDTYDFRSDYHEGDTTKGDVGTYLLDPENIRTEHLYKQFFGDDPDNEDGHHSNNPDQAAAAISLDPNITGDGIIDAAEAAGQITITGTVGGDVRDGDIVTLTVNNNTYTGTVSDGKFSIEVPGAELADDANSEIEASVTITDASGNAITATDTEGYVVDTTAPSAAVDIADDGNNQDMISSTDDLTNTRLSGTIEANGTIIGLTVSDGTNSIVIPADTVTVAGDGTWSTTVDVSSLADGTLTVSLDSEDALGNQALTATDSIKKDTVTTVAIDDIASTNDPTPAASGSGEPGSTIVLTDSSGKTVGSATVQEDGSWTAKLDSLADGEYTIAATATDPYGNSAEAVTSPFIVDTTAPTSAVDIADDANNQDMISSTDDLTATRLSGSIEPDGTITGLKVSDGSNTIVIAPEDVTVAGDGTWSTRVDVSSLADGALTVTLDSEDALGNKAITAADSINKDTVTTVTIDDIADTNDATPAVSGTGEPGSNIVLTDSNGNTVGSVIVQRDGSWTAELDDLPEGNNTITATATDPYGNSADAVTPPFIVDTTASTPLVTVSDAEGSEDTAIPLNISSALTDTDGSESLSDITISGIPVGAVLSAGTDNGDGSWTLTQEQLTGLTITPPENSDDDFTLTASATSTESNGDTATATENIDVTVNAVADAPTVTLNITGQNVVSDGLVGHWVFDENDTAGGRTYNLVDDREGILTGNAQFNSEGHTNSSMVLDGNGDYVDVVGDYNTPLAGTATLSAWIKLPDGFTGVAGNKDIGWDSPSIIGSEQNGGTNDIQWGWISDDGHINMGVANSYGAESTTKVNDGAWHHVVLTRDHVTGETKVYVDGVLEDTAVTVTGIKNSTPISGFGATFGSNGANEYLQGELDDIRIYDRVLTDYEISQISTYENNLNDYDLVGLEGEPIPFTVDAGLVDTDGSESITSMIISDIPEGATLTDGSNVFTATGANNAVDVLSWDKNNLSITADANNGGEGQPYTLTVSATTTESSNTDSATTSVPLKIFVIDTAPVALDDHDSVGFGGKASGNLILGIGGEDMEADELGHDPTTVSSITFGDTAYFFNSNGNLVDGAGQPIADNTIRADHGTLQINNDGSYSYISEKAPSNVTHLDTFSYTLVDADGDTSTADFSVSHDSLTTVSDSAMVYEAGLASGTAAASALEVIAGNLLDNDLGVGATARITQIASDGNTDTSAAKEILTVDTAHGTIKVHTADTTEHRAGDYEYTLTSATAGDNVIDTISYTVNNSHGGSSVSSLEISIVDDAPIGSNITNNIEDIDNSSQTTNLIIVLDRSGSMGWDLEGNRSGSTNFNMESVRMDIAKEALSSMFDSFDNLGNVNIQFVPFSSNASKSQWFIDDKDGANDYLNGITPNGGTYYDTALEKTVDDYDPPGADKTLVYFISDGEPTDGHKISATEKANWESFIETNKVDIAFGIGITDNVNLDSLTPIAYPNTNEDGDLDPYAIQVVNAFDLQQTLLETVSEGIVRGDISVLNESVDGGIVIGADGGHIQSIMADGVLHEYDPVSNQTESVTTNRGGTISINYETGEYYYIINPKNTVSGEQETFVVTAADNDGDTTSVDLVIHLDYLATLDANSDRIITNTAEGDSLSIAHDMLLANDAGSSQVTIDNITPDAGTDLTTSPDEITLTDLADGENFTYQITAEGVSDSARVEVVRVDAAQLHGTSGDDILINSSSATLSDAAPALYGEEGDDYLQGSNGDEIFDGGEGRDTTDAGDGDDTIVFDRADAHIDGGNGLDTLLIADDALDFSVLRDGTIENIEKIDLSGSAAQRVSLTLDDVLDMTGVENVLEVRGEAGDTVAIDVTGWTQDENNSGLFSKGGDIVSIVSSADSDNAIHIDYTDDGTEVG